MLACLFSAEAVVKAHTSQHLSCNSACYVVSKQTENRGFPNGKHDSEVVCLFNPRVGLLVEIGGLKPKIPARSPHNRRNFIQ